MNKIFFSLQPQKRLPAYGLFLSLGTFITFLVLMSSPSDPKNAVFLGYSLELILLGAGLLIPGIALLFLTVSLFRNPEHSLRLWHSIVQRTGSRDGALFTGVAIFLSLWVLLFMPEYRLGWLASYVTRLFPILVWLAVTSAVTIIILFLERRQDAGAASMIGNRIILKTSAIVLFILLLIMFFVSLTGFGIRYPEDYWYGAGVPVLGLQILFPILLGAFVLLMDRKLDVFDRRRLDIFIFIAIWIIAAWLWAREPISPNYFMPDTADNVIYPYSDGATFDTGAQYALIGQGIFNGIFFERILYSVFLSYLHLFLGQDIEMLMTAQAALFAVLPAIIYLIGRELHSRALGISVGALMVVRGVNAIIAAKWIDTASPKMMLTDFPTAIGLSLLLLLLVKWIKQPAKVSLLMWAGALFALTFMVRSNVLTLLPVMLVFILFVLKQRWKQTVLAGLLILLGVTTVTLPWELRNQSRGIPMYSMYYSRIMTVLRSRYNIGGDAYLPPRESIFADVRDTRGMTRQRMLGTGAEFACDSVLCAIPNHFLHNMVTSFVSLPTALVFDDLWNTVKADKPYWKKEWGDGTVGMAGVILILFNLALTSLGVGSLWKRAKVLALLPILVFATYLFTNALGLTSGGRYIAPVDWIVYLYFITGGLQLVIWLLQSAGFSVEEEDLRSEDTNLPPLKKDVLVKTLPAIGFILAVGALLPISEMFFEPRYQVRQPGEILSQLEEAGFLEQSGFSRDDLLVFLSQPNAMIREGRALYPRYYPSGEGEQDRSTYYRYLDYQRLVFTLISPYAFGAEGVVIPGFAPPFSFHAGDVITLGCFNTTYYAPYIDAVVVFYTSGEGFVYLRDPGVPLQCPLPEPK